ncbi:uncharacterized protein [Malus domestica]|uniref:uncharacterized protein n=1 Tax=Malus domestica TaxID=3750 RepID=UPI0039756394
MESEKEFPELNQSLYPNIEPERMERSTTHPVKTGGRDRRSGILLLRIQLRAQKPIENDATRDNLGTNSTANEKIVQEKLLLFLDVTGGWKSDYLFEVSTD